MQIRDYNAKNVTFLSIAKRQTTNIKQIRLHEVLIIFYEHFSLYSLFPRLSFTRFKQATSEGGKNAIQVEICLAIVPKCGAFCYAIQANSHKTGEQLRCTKGTGHVPTKGTNACVIAPKGTNACTIAPKGFLSTIAVIHFFFWPNILQR